MATGFVLPASAGEQTSASFTTDCRNEEGYIHVTINDFFEDTYDILIGGVLVGDNVEGGVHNYGPYADGSYVVQVIWSPDGDVDLINETAEIDCVPDVTTTTAAPTTSTTVAETTTTQAAQPPAPLPVTPQYTG